MVGRPRKIGKRKPCGRLVQAGESPINNYAKLFLDDPMAVYVMEAGPRVKIGISDNPNSRIKQIQVGNGEISRIFWFGWLERKDAQQLEAAIHRANKNSVSHCIGEWYFFSPANAVEIVRTAARRLRFKVICDPFEDLSGEPFAYYFKASETP